jgi:hypothetical protein
MLLIKRLRYLCQDETRLGLKTEMGKVIMAFGVKQECTCALES